MRSRHGYVATTTVLDRRSHPDNKEQWRKRTKRGEWGRLAVNTEIAGPSYVGQDTVYECRLINHVWSGQSSTESVTHPELPESTSRTFAQWWRTFKTNSLRFRNNYQFLLCRQRLEHQNQTYGYTISARPTAPLPFCHCSARGLTNRPDHSMLEPESICDGLVDMFVGYQLKGFLASAVYRQNMLLTHFFSSGNPETDTPT